MTLTLPTLLFLYPTALVMIVFLFWFNLDRRLHLGLESKRKKIYCRSCGALNKIDLPRIQFRCKNCGARQLIAEESLKNN
jgi:predicted RNA-binding Zn-ribbon protein involved in translation (DUF1610 family)